MSIPKKIHYCWFGGAPLGKNAQRCIKSWQRFCPDFEIVRWDESNSPLQDNLYVRQAYEAKKWAFVSDYVRAAVLCEQGGIYLDTDVELLAPLEPFLEHEAFLGFESPASVATCLLACRAGHPFFRQVKEMYDTLPFLSPQGVPDMTTNVVRITALLSAHGLIADGSRQSLCGVEIYPSPVFSPKSLETGKITLTPETRAIHYFDASWMSLRQRFHTRLAQLLGPRLTLRLKRLLGKST